MKLWKLRQKHHDELQALSKELGFLDSKGRMRKFDGPELRSRWKALGHSHYEMDECQCLKQAEDLCIGCKKRTALVEGSFCPHCAYHYGNIWLHGVPQILIHSANPVGIQRMKQVIASIYRMQEDKNEQA